MEQLKEYLHDKSFLLLLDNFEQVVTAASLLVELLLDCPGLKVLVTSRTALHVRLEHKLSVAPLVLPDISKKAPLDFDVEFLSRYAAVQLFLQRARAIKPNFNCSGSFFKLNLALRGKTVNIPE